MSQLPRKIALPITQQALHAYLEDQNNVLAHKINYGSSFGNTAPDNNIDCWMVTVASSGTGANNEFFVNHNLLRIPIFFHWISDDGSVLYSFYPGMSAWTQATSAGNDGKIFIKSTGPNTGFKIIIF